MRPRLFRLVGCVPAAGWVLGVILAAAPAHAQPAKRGPPSGAQPSRSGDAVAAYSAQARQAYEAGSFRDAIALYEKAYAIEPEPTLLFNLARCHEALGALEDLRAAVRAYGAYLEASPRTSDRAAIERRVEALRKQVAIMEAEQRRPAEAEATKRPSPPPAPVAPRAASPWPWVVCGVGAGGVVAGAILGVLATDAHDDAQASPSGRDAIDLESRAGTLETATNVAFVAGAALAVAGCTWAVIDMASASSPPPAAAARAPARARVELRVGAGAMSVGGTF
jgi:tetratricopeptide (TPR) repeat protein